MSFFTSAMRMVSIKCQMKEAPRTHNPWQTSPLRARAGARGLNGLGLRTSRSGLLIDSENGTSLDPRSAYGVKNVVTNTLHSSDAACQVPLYTHYIFPEKIMNTVALLGSPMQCYEVLQPGKSSNLYSHALRRVESWNSMPEYG